MITGGPLKAYLRATWHMLRRRGHKVETFYLGNRLCAMHCRDCLRDRIHFRCSVPEPRGVDRCSP